MATTPAAPAANSQMKPQLFSGARGAIYIKDQTTPVAFVTDISVSVQANVRPTYVIGSLNPVGLEPLSEDVNVSIGRIIPINSSNAKTVVSPAFEASKDKFTAIDYGHEERMNAILTADSIDIAIMDKVTQKTIAFIRYCRFAGRTTSMSMGDIANERYQFVGIYDSANNSSEDVNFGMENKKT